MGVLQSTGWSKLFLGGVWVFPGGQLQVKWCQCCSAEGWLKGMPQQDNSWDIVIHQVLIVYSPVHPKGNQCWIFTGRTDAEAETPILWPPDCKRAWCWERLKVGREGDDRGWDGRMASPTWWIWVWVNCGSWWWTGRPSVLQSMGSQRVGHDWATELNWFTRY